MQKIINELKNYKWIYLSLVLILFLGAGFRLYNLGGNSFVADEFLDVNATYGYFQTGEWQAWDFNFGQESVRDNKLSDKRAWIYRWQVSQLYKFLPPTEFTIRLVSALWGILTILILYLVSFSLTKNRTIALISAFLWVVSVPALEINRKIRMYSMFAPIFLLFSWSVFQFLESGKNRVLRNFGVKIPDKFSTKIFGNDRENLGKNKNWKNVFFEIFSLNWIFLIPVLIFGFLSFHLHQLTGNIALVVFVYCLVRFIVDFKNCEKINRFGIYFVLIILATFLFSVLFKEQFKWFLDTLKFFENHYSYFKHINLNFESALIGWFFILVGSWYLLKNKETSKSGLWVISNFFVIFLASIFLWNRVVGGQYIFFVQNFVLILVASGIFALAKFIINFPMVNFQKISIFHKNFQFNKNQLSAIIILLFLVFVPNYTYFLQENNTFQTTSESENPNYRNIFLYLKKNKKDGDVLITRNLRNYYLSGLKIPVFDFGSERDEESLKAEGKVKEISLNYVKEIVAKNPTGWVIFSDNDKTLFKKEALKYFDENFEKIGDSLLIKGKVSVYRWGN